MLPKEIILIGAGNLGFHLGKKLFETGFQITQVYSQTMAHAEELASTIQAEPITEIEKLNKKSDLYLIAVRDDVIPYVVRHLEGIQGMIVHTSGASLSTSLAPLGDNYGVFWPMQTMKRNRPADFNNIPVVITGCNESTEKSLIEIAKKIGAKTFVLKEDDRRLVHVAAVFLNNFTNHMAVAAYDILDQRNLPHELLFPLLEETVQAIGAEHPENNQTGPAVRGDRITMARHIEMLRSNQHYAQVYEAVSQSIQRRSKKG